MKRQRTTNLRLGGGSGVISSAFELITQVLGGALLRVGLQGSRSLVLWARVSDALFNAGNQYEHRNLGEHCPT